MEITNNTRKHLSAKTKRAIVWLVILTLVAISLFFAFLPRAISVELYTLAKNTLTVTIEEEGQTRVHDVFTLSAPVSGKIERISLRVGDSVMANQTELVILHPAEPAFLDQRSEAQARAAVETARSAQALARAEIERVQAESSFAKKEYERAQALFQQGIIPVRAVEEATRLNASSQAVLQSARAALQMRNFELKQAEAMLLVPGQSKKPGTNCECIPLTAPVSGQVLKVFNPSERNVNSGEALLEIGDASELEIIVDLLSADAVQVQTGQRVIIDNWGGDSVLEGRVSRIEPFGFTKISALGIEEQRVNVVIDFVSPKASWQRLGHGYQVETGIVLSESKDVLTVPLTALFRTPQSTDQPAGNQWGVFVARDGRAHMQKVLLGNRNGLVAEVVSGLSENDKIVMHPSNKVVDNVRILDRAESL